jgi:hypothetical protein
MERRKAGGGVPLLNAYVPRTEDAQTRVNIVPTCDKPLEQCAVANVLQLRRGPATRIRTHVARCVEAGGGRDRRMKNK